MEIQFEEIIKNEYFGKIILSLIPLILKGFFGKDSDPKKYWLIIINYLLPIATIIWINLDKNIVINKLTVTLIAFNFILLIFNYFQQNLISHYKLITQFTSTETDKIKEINQINSVQVEKVKAINENQKYILEELSKINDRIIKYFFSDKSKEG